MTTTRRVYRLHVEYPKGSDEWGWEPEGWDDGWSGDPDNDASFRWPIEKLYLSKSGARGRARLFEKYGATVTIEASEPVVWASDNGRNPPSTDGEG